MNWQERVYGCLQETRSATSRAKTKGRKLYGTGGLFGRKGEYAKRDATGKSVRAHGHGKRAAKELASAKVYRQAASDIESYSKTNPGPDPKRRKDVTATAATALRDTARRKEGSAKNQIKAGKQAAGNKRAVNRVLKRDETMKNLEKLTIRKKSATNENIYDPTPKGPKPKVGKGSVRSTLKGKARKVWDKAQAAKKKKVTEAEAGTMNQLFSAQSAEDEAKRRTKLTGKGTKVKPSSKPKRRLPGWARRSK